MAIFNSYVSSPEGSQVSKTNLDPLATSGSDFRDVAKMWNTKAAVSSTNRYLWNPITLDIIGTQLHWMDIQIIHVYSCWMLMDTKLCVFWVSISKVSIHVLRINPPKKSGAITNDVLLPASARWDGTNKNQTGDILWSLFQWSAIKIHKIPHVYHHGWRNHDQRTTPLLNPDQNFIQKFIGKKLDHGWCWMDPINP